MSLAPFSDLKRLDYSLQFWVDSWGAGQFNELNKPAEISFSVQGDINEECKAQLKAMALANRVGKPYSPWILTIITLCIITILIFFHQFTPTPHERLRKREFLELAKGQGQSDEDALREWQDYRRRF